VNIAGNTSLAAVGETSQLTASATYSDGSSNEAPGGVQWFTQLATVATVSQAGLLTATGLGTTRVSARLPEGGALGFVDVKVLPPGTFIISGSVREPGAGRLAGVRISEAVSGLSTTSGGNGDFTLIGVRSLHLLLEKNAYESKTLDASAGAADVPMQPIVRVAAGGSTSTTLAPNDMSYTVAPGTTCWPCRMIRVVMPQAGQLETRVTWTQAQARIGLWIDGRRFVPAAGGPLEIVAETPVAAGETLIYADVNRLPGSLHVLITIAAAAK
jgi:hypothetical protein